MKVNSKPLYNSVLAAVLTVTPNGEQLKLAKVQRWTEILSASCLCAAQAFSQATEDHVFLSPSFLLY